MVIRLYLSRTSGNVVMKVQQEYIKRILETKNIDYQEIDVADPNQLKEKEFMQNLLKVDETVPLPPQLFKDDKYRGDFDGFFTAVETESMFRYLDLDVPQTEVEYIRLRRGSE